MTQERLRSDEIQQSTTIDPEVMMSIPVPGREFETQVAPWDDQELLEEQDAIDRLNAAVEQASGATDAARLAVIAVGNYIWQSQDWPQFIERANELLNELEGTQSRRWG
jgi:2-methylisocitrate lyase-like PEP mutase family enzyme